jgi:hypothetical protein
MFVNMGETGQMFVLLRYEATPHSALLILAPGESPVTSAEAFVYPCNDLFWREVFQNLHFLL